MAIRRARAARADPVPPPLHELEAEVMEELWSSGEAPVRAVMDALTSRTSPPRAHTTTPAHARSDCMALRARAEIDHLVAQYGDVALSNFAQQMADLDPARRRAL